MRYRKLSTDDDDYVFGHGGADFYVDSPDAVAQAVKTRLHLGLGEWFLDTTDGTPWKTKVLGKYTSDTRDAVIRARILGTEGVTMIESYSSSLDRDTRAFSAAATIDTEYGTTTVTETL